MTRHGLSIEERFWPKVHKTETCWLWTAGKFKHGYGAFYLNGKTIQAHRISYEMANGSIPDGMHIDHRCHTPSCVNPTHLRLTTPKQNHENLRGALRGSFSGIRGVGWNKGTKKWRAYAVHHGKFRHGGEFATKDEAAEAARQLRLSLFTHSDMDRRAS